MSRGSSELLAGLLKDVSRSFYLTLRVLPGAIRPQIGLAYLLARASDTIADTDAIPKAERAKALSELGQRVEQPGGASLDLGRLAGHQSSVAERVLLQRLPEALHVLARFEPADQDRIRTVLRVIMSGQALDLERFADASLDRVAALETDAQLDDYTYRVAGCVGEFWTRMCRARLFPKEPLDDVVLLANGVRFGKGLQLVNVLRDLPADLRLGRCYLPRLELRNAGLQPAELLDPANEPRLRPLYDNYLNAAEEHLEAGWNYTNALPRGQIRVRLACAWPILIGMQTLAQLRASQVLDPSRRIKISRQQVRGVLVRSILWCGWPERWRGLFRSAKGPAGKPLPQRGTLAK